MAWIDNYRQAKFRNANFYVPNAENSGGRRGVIHEFPKQDVPYIEDMGKKARTYRIEAYVLGEDYFTDRDSLVNALEKEGAGTFVHPYLGEINVFCTNYSFIESSRETRIARFTITFVDAGNLSNPTVVIDTTANVKAKKAAAIAASNTVLAEEFDMTTVSYAVIENAKEAIETAIDDIEEAKKTVADIASYKQLISTFKGKIEQLIYDTIDLAKDTSDIFTFGTNVDDSFKATASNSRDQFRETIKLIDFEPDQSDEMADKFGNFIKQQSAINAIGLMSIIEWDSVNEADEFKKIVFDKLEAMLLSVTDDDLYTTLYDLQTAISQDIDVRIKNLPSLAEHTLNQSQSVLEVSYFLYGNIDDEQDIIYRNRIEHPLFTPAGVALEVKVYA